MLMTPPYEQRARSTKKVGPETLATRYTLPCGRRGAHFERASAASAWSDLVIDGLRRDHDRNLLLNPNLECRLSDHRNQAAADCRLVLEFEYALL